MGRVNFFYKKNLLQNNILHDVYKQRSNKSCPIKNAALISSDAGVMYVTPELLETSEQRIPDIYTYTVQIKTSL